LAITQPQCKGCSHPRSFHGNGEPCKALGCSCQAYLSPFDNLWAPGKPISPYSKEYVVTAAVGQVWEDNDVRMAGRRLRIESIEEIAGEQTAHVIWLDGWGNPNGKTSKIRVRRLRPTSNGYRLVSEP